MITKCYMLLSLLESLWLKLVVFHLCGQVQFLSRKQFVCEHFRALLQKIVEVYVIRHWLVCNCDNNF
jgi:hypothetical protein